MTGAKQKKLNHRTQAIAAGCIFLAALLFYVCFPAGRVFAAVPAVTEEERIGDSGEQDNNELLQSYFEHQLGTAGASSAAPKLKAARRSVLNPAEQQIYQVLLRGIKAAAEGKREHSYFEIDITDLLENTTFSSADLGVIQPVKDNGELTDEAVAAVRDRIDIASRYTTDNRVYNTTGQINSVKIVNALLSDVPYELYWFNKVKGYSKALKGLGQCFEYDDANDTLTLKSTERIILQYWFRVADAYQSGEAERYPTTYIYYLNTEKCALASQAAKNALAIVSNAERLNLDDYEKLVQYREEIRSLAPVYNNEAKNSGIYGDPWQVIYVFDGDPGTNVVCEGYAKAFKYLCDLSRFLSAEIECSLAVGSILEGNHMWNIVHMEDGNNYLVDITNSRSDLYRFMRGGRPDAAGKWWVELPGGRSVYYLYDANTVEQFDSSELTLCRSDYIRSLKIGDGQGIETTGDETVYTGSSLQLACLPAPDYTSVKDAVWTSSRPSVASVDEHGLVKAESAGEAVIRVETNAGTRSASCR